MNIALIGATGEHRQPRPRRSAAPRPHRHGHHARSAQGRRRGPAWRSGPAARPTRRRWSKILKGHDVVVVSVKWNENDIRHVIDTIRKSGVKRCLFVIGAGSLLRKDGRTHFDTWPRRASSRRPPCRRCWPTRRSRRSTTSTGRRSRPPPRSRPGERTGKFRLGLDKLIENAKGESRISREDFAIAIVDEIEKPKHVKKRFTVGY